MAALGSDERKELERLRNLADSLKEGVDNVLGPKKETPMGKARTVALGSKHVVKSGFRGIRNFFKNAAQEEAIEMEVEKQIADTVEETRKKVRQQMLGPKDDD